MTLSKSKSLNHGSNNSSQVNNHQECADCGSRNTQWASLNHGVVICDDCCLAHRNLGRCISVIKSLRKSYWPQSLIDTLYDLVRNNSNQIWESNLHSNTTDNKSFAKNFKKPTPKDSNATKLNFIKMKYENLAFVARGKYSSIEELNQQLYSSVKKNNYEQTLRILSQGADANYRNQEDGYQCLHAAVVSNQLGQIELLCLYGADIVCLDRNGNTPLDLAKQNNFTQIVDRLNELQFELTDELSYFLSNKRPDHKSGKHFLIPSNIGDNLINHEELSRNTKQKLQQLPDHLFEELCKDIYDELDRRQIENIWKSTVGPKLVNEPIPFLIIKSCFTQTRNQLRQKLARFNVNEFSNLLVDILVETQRRYNQIDQHEAKLEQKNDEINLFSDEEDPLYDKVPSDEDYASVASESSTNFQSLCVDKSSKSKQSNQTLNINTSSPSKNGDVSKSPSTTPSKNSNKSPNTNGNGKPHASSSLVANAESTLNTIINSLNQIEYTNQNENSNTTISSNDLVVDRSIFTSFNELKSENELMQSMIERLMEENAQLRADKMLLSAASSAAIIPQQQQQQNFLMNLNSNFQNYFNQPDDINLYATVKNKKMEGMLRENFYLDNNPSNSISSPTKSNQLNSSHFASKYIPNDTMVNQETYIAEYSDRKFANKYENTITSVFENYELPLADQSEFFDPQESFNNHEHDYDAALLNNKNFFENQLKIVEDEDKSETNTQPLFDHLSSKNSVINGSTVKMKSLSHDNSFLKKLDDTTSTTSKTQAALTTTSSSLRSLPFTKSFNMSISPDNTSNNFNTTTTNRQNEKTKETEADNNSAVMPTKSAVIRKMKKITKAVQDLFKAAKDSELSLLKDLCDKVNIAVHEMIVLFPENMESNTITENLILLDETCKNLVEIVSSYHSKIMKDNITEASLKNMNSSESGTDQNSSSSKANSNGKTSISTSSSSSSAISSGSNPEVLNHQVISEETIALKNMIVGSLINYSYEIAHTVKRIVCLIGADN